MENDNDLKNSLEVSEAHMVIEKNLHSESSKSEIIAADDCFSLELRKSQIANNANRNLKRSRLQRTHKIQSKKFCAKEERNASIKKVAVILQKSEHDRTSEELKVLSDSFDAVEEVQLRWRKRDEAKRRIEEIEDPIDVLNQKCQILAQAIAQSQHLVVYTGAGISTAAQIPDYRGPNGIWTRLQQGKDIGNHDLTLAEPTYTHMALHELYRRKILKYVVSQNCDGLHLRSGLPRNVLSEVHGNMYIEVCKSCKPVKEYWRIFDVTENTARYAHKTYRKCYLCNEPLLDTIVHFGERGSLQWPLNWIGASNNAKKATTIVCLGSSLKVLKKYPWLWQMHKPMKKRPNLYIVNLQWTPKDDCANVKIHGKCDKVMEIVMSFLGIVPPKYVKENDPIYAHCSQLNEMELHTTTQPFLKEILKHELKEEKDFKSQNVGLQEKDCLINYSKHDDLTKPATKNIAVCDNICNSKCNSVVIPHSLPSKNVNHSTSVFSIDSILQSHNVSENNALDLRLPQNNYSDSKALSSSIFFNPFLGYHLPSNFVQEQILGAYPNFILYPFQTSFLYSGLHSIINPVSYVKEEIIEKPKPSCDFCYKHLDSIECLFYTSVKPIFINQQYRFSKVEQKEKMNICSCCDYSTDEEDLETDLKDECNENKEDLKLNKVQPGWFGKGYKRNGRLKRK